MVEAHIHCRVAARDDAAGICGVLTEAPPEIPLLIDTRERREAVSGIVDSCIATGESCVATDGRGAIAGFILAEPDELERFQHDNHALHLRYAGVANTYRRQGIFRALIQLRPSKSRTSVKWQHSCSASASKGRRAIRRSKSISGGSQDDTGGLETAQRLTTCMANGAQESDRR